MRATLLCCAFALVARSAAALAGGAAVRLRTEYLENPLGIDVPAPRFSWALSHPSRGEYQTTYQIVVSTTPAVGTPSVVWNSGVVSSNKTLNIVYSGSPLVSDSDYSWTVTWADSAGVLSPPASATFSTALMSTADWRGAAWLMGNTTEENVFRATFSASAMLAVVRARLFICGLGYAKAYVNGARTDSLELGTFTTFQQRTLYESFDVTSLIRPGPNTLGVTLGHGWYAEPSVNVGPRQLIALVSVTTADGTTAYFPSALSSSAAAAAAATPLTFSAAKGPVIADNIYIGETFDGRIAAAMAGWNENGYTPGPPPSPAWSPAVPAANSPPSFNATFSSHGLPITTDRDYTVLPGGITQPGPGQYVFDFGQNMAGQTTLSVTDCPAGTVITLQHAEVLFVNGSVRDTYSNAPMQQIYTCAGSVSGPEVYRTQFTYYGFRYIGITGFPGVPDESTLTAHFVHSAVPQSGDFSSSSPLLNSVHHATRYASWSNLMDVPTDCPQRERRGWLGDAQLSFETVIHNVDGGSFYKKWIQDLVDTQIYDNATMNAEMALPDCVPFYGHGHTESDPGWGIAGWLVPDKFATFYDDDAFEASYYPHMRAYMEHWITLANGNNGVLPVFHWGDWGNFYPGPYEYKTPEYPQYFYIIALDTTAAWATRLGFPADAARYQGLSTSARTLYNSLWYNASTFCYANCVYVSQIFALDLGLQPAGSAAEAAVWANALSWFSANGTNAKYPEHFGGGIISLKLVYDQLTQRGLVGLGLRMMLQPTTPSPGYWVTDGATTLWESYSLTSTEGGGSYNHIMFGGAQWHLYQDYAGLGRLAGSRSWTGLDIAPPDGDVLDTISYASASIDTPMGLVASSWSANSIDGTCGEVQEKGNLTLTCGAGGVFTGVAFASYGAPTGGCSSLSPPTINATCNANTSTAVVAAACVGKSSCTIQATTATFGGSDPCFDVLKRLLVVLEGPCGAPLYSAQATLPPNARGSVRVPTLGLAPSAATITEGGAIVWKAGAFVPGTPGITAAVADPSGANAVVFSVGSGAYEFVALQG